MVQSWIVWIITSVSHDPSEITLICCSRNIFIIVNVENHFAASLFYKFVVYFDKEFFE